MNWFSVFDIKDAFELMYDKLKENHPSLTRRILVENINRLFSVLSVYIKDRDISKEFYTDSIHDVGLELITLLCEVMFSDTEFKDILTLYTESTELIKATVPKEMLAQHVLSAICISPKGDEMIGFFGEMSAESEKVISDVFLKLGLKP
jgi:hypothetical protein